MMMQSIGKQPTGKQHMGRQWLGLNATAIMMLMLASNGWAADVSSQPRSLGADIEAVQESSAGLSGFSSHESRLGKLPAPKPQVEAPAASLSAPTAAPMAVPTAEARLEDAALDGISPAAGRPTEN